MLFIPGFVINIATFPGIIVHEMAHKFFCDLTGTPVYDVKYFQFGNVGGYVIHGEPKNIRSSFLISMGPLLINTLLCMIFSFPMLYLSLNLGASPDSIAAISLLWLGLSIGMHAFPSNTDLDSFTSMVKKAERNVFYYLAAMPFSIFMKIVNLLQIVWFDLIYAIGVAFILPLLLG